MLDPAVRIACLSNGCCDCSRGGDARRATGTCARRKRVIDAGAFRTARECASGGIGRSTRLYAVRSLRLVACTERERLCTEGDGHCHAGLSAGPSMPKAPAPTQGNVFRDRPTCRIHHRPPLPVLHDRDDRLQGERTVASRRAVRESGDGICGLRRGASHRIAVSLSRLSTAARHGCHGSSHASGPACRYLRRSAPRRHAVGREAVRGSGRCSLCSG